MEGDVETHQFDEPIGDELVVEDALQRPHQEGVERQVAHLLRLKVAVDLFELFVALERLFQLLQDQPVLLDVALVQLRKCHHRFPLSNSFSFFLVSFR